MKIAEVHVRAGGLSQFHRAAIVNLRLLFVSFLQLQIAEQELHDRIVGNERGEILHTTQRFGLIRLLVRRDRGDDDWILDAADPRSHAIERDWQRGDD